MIGVYYNEIDPFAAQWLRELINAVQAQAFIEAVIQIKQKEEWCG